MMKDKILREFDNSKDTLIGLRDKMTTLLKDLIESESIQIHQVSSRLKERNSLEGKIDRKQNAYHSLDDITDIVGIRIITYLESDVDLIADIIANEFEIDEKNSIDKRKLKSDQFGYRSLHFVLSCKKERIKLAEYKRFNNLKFEIQIRSILQHAWAEIEHDLGYKGFTSIPDNSKRSFNRLAALLESADLEFVRLKNELTKYESEVEGRIRTEPENVSIDQASISSFARSNSVIVEAQNIIMNNVGCIFSPNSNFEREIQILRVFFGIEKISELHSIIVENRVLFLEFVNELTRGFDYRELTDSVTILYVLHLLAVKDENKDTYQRYDEALNMKSINGPLDLMVIMKRAKKSLHDKS